MVYEKFVARGDDRESMRIAKRMMARHVISSAPLDLNVGRVDDAAMKLRKTIRPGWRSERVVDMDPGCTRADQTRTSTTSVIRRWAA